VYLKDWELLPTRMKNPYVREYYEHLKKKPTALWLKRTFDIFISFILIYFSMPIILTLALFIVLDSGRPILFRQKRVTQYGKIFKIYKFRTMVVDAEKLGTHVTTKGDLRITRIGRFLRKFRLDELPQLFNIFLGDMSFVGTRPEVPKYYLHYTDIMLATLLLPAGVTSEASIFYKDEEKYLSDTGNADQTYSEIILPEKMNYNLEGILKFSMAYELKIMIKTVLAVMKN
jgi:lipopolysaccharide/colanic/teichoic acid biosynthesis glycosyltransferase